MSFRFDACDVVRVRALRGLGFYLKNVSAGDFGHDDRPRPTGDAEKKGLWGSRDEGIAERRNRETKKPRGGKTASDRRRRRDTRPAQPFHRSRRTKNGGGRDRAESAAPELSRGTPVSRGPPSVSNEPRSRRIRPNPRLRTERPTSSATRTRSTPFRPERSERRERRAHGSLAEEIRESESENDDADENGGRKTSGMETDAFASAASAPSLASFSRTRADGGKGRKTGARGARKARGDETGRLLPRRRPRENHRQRTAPPEAIRPTQDSPYTFSSN